MKNKFKGSTAVAIILFLSSGVATSILGARQYERISTTPAWVLNTALEKGSVITTRNLIQARIDKDTAQSSIQDPAKLIGKELALFKRSGDVVYQDDIMTPVKRSLSHAIPEGRVLYTLQYIQGGTPLSQLNSGDRLDVVVRGQRSVRTVARDVQLIGIIRPERGEIEEKKQGVLGLLDPRDKDAKAGGGAPSLVMAIRPGDVFPLASIGSNDKVSLVIHSAHDIAKGTRQSVDPARTYREVEVVSGLQRSTVRIGM
ncbi:MAG TPA: hypothetical protein DCF62_03055 [Porticoccaceae bacterium]|nr:hypothetical protein [Porticoccaceae bacterium]HCO60092.1 hypothetical protein [Porticoccaceae bacterium]